MMAEDGGLGVMHPATALMSVSLVRGMVGVIMSSAELITHYSTHDSSALGDFPVAGSGGHIQYIGNSFLLGVATRLGVNDSKL